MKPIQHTILCHQDLIHISHTFQLISKIINDVNIERTLARRLEAEIF